MNKFDYAKISSDNVRLLLLHNKMSVRQLAEKINVAPTTLNDSLKSKKGISIDSLIKIADIFNVTVNDLCNPCFCDPKKNNDEIAILNKYKSLDNRGKELINCIIDKEIERITE